MEITREQMTVKIEEKTQRINWGKEEMNYCKINSGKKEKRKRRK